MSRAGGNNALDVSVVLGQRVRSVGEAVGALAAAQAAFAAEYRAMLDMLFGRRLRTAVCTIYDANHPEPERRVIVAALALFNDVVTRAMFARGLALIDLRLICRPARRLRQRDQAVGARRGEDRGRDRGS